MHTSILLVLCFIAFPSSNCCNLSISGVAENIRNEKSVAIDNENGTLIARYGDDVTIFCSGHDFKNLKLQLDIKYGREDTEQKTEIVNMTTIKLFMEKPGINSYEYVCTEEDTNCSVKISASVEPAIEIVSPNVQYLRRDNLKAYFVPVGEEYEVFCSGDTNNNLVVEQEYQDEHNIETTRVNETTIVSKPLKEDKYALLHYTCNDKDKNASETVGIYVYFNHIPAAQNFWCVTGFDMEVNCSWSLLSVYVSQTLFYVDSSGKSMRVYEDHKMTKENRSCGFNMAEIWEKELSITKNVSFVMQSCTFMFCSNETHHIRMDNAFKSRPPVELKVLRTTWKSALVSWIELRHSHDMGKLEYKVTYQLPGGPQRELNSSTLRVICRDSTICKAELKLPCPGTLYEIRVFSKLQNTRKNKYGDYWSDPATITLRTKGTTNKTQAMSNISVVCDADPKEELQVLKALNIFI